MNQWEQQFNASYAVPRYFTDSPNWIDTSYRHDACPSFTLADDESVKVWVEHPDKTMREYDDASRYCFYNAIVECHVESDDFSTFIDAIESFI